VSTLLEEEVLALETVPDEELLENISEELWFEATLEVTVLLELWLENVPDEKLLEDVFEELWPEAALEVEVLLEL